ncbi:hypothetical protein Q0N68_14565, partial [Staphylococcus aureus]|nr:hypothetical protein [Staphylococcus aureus]
CFSNKSFKYSECLFSKYLKDLFEKHISKIQKFESDLLKLTYCIDYEIDFKLSENWLNGSVSGRKISDVLNEVGFYIL